MRQKTAACPVGEEMMIVMPFAGNKARPELIDREILLIEV
jgi:hypothetical protein